MPLKLASLNIEGNEHFGKFLPFLKGFGPDVACLQEVFAQDVPMLRRELEMDAAFAPMCVRPYDSADMASPAVMGVAVFSKLPFGSVEPLYYYGDPDFFPVYRYRDDTRQNRVLLMVTLDKDGAPFTVGTTHFMVTKDAEPTDFQRRDLARLFGLLGPVPEIVMCGDWNAPRGGEIFGRLAERFRDNIPPEYAASIDGNIHRAGHLPYMVDGLFTTPGFAASDVKLTGGVSDHMAITAVIERVS